jgi:tol-pal system protein YbgF
MKHIFFLFPLLLLTVVPAFSQKEPSQKEQVTMILRTLNELRDELSKRQAAQDAKIALLQTTASNADAAAKQAVTAVTLLEGAVRERLKAQETLLVAPIAGLGAKVDTMSTDFAGVRESVTDLSSRMGKLQNQIADINSAIKILAAPPAPPPAAGNPAASAAPAGVSAETLYNGAMRDKSAGRSDLAVEGFQNYLKWFGNTDLAPNAQYYIGEIKYLRGDLDGALMAFDTLLEKYPDNPKTSDAMLQKGRALVKAGFKAEARQEFTSLVKKFPAHDNAAKARTELASLNASAPSRTAKKK